jgi:ketosteroid isomerase-like protein
MILPDMVLAAAIAATGPATPQETVDSLLHADRAFSSAAADVDPAAGLAAMLDPEVAMPVPGKGIIVGRDAVVSVLQSSPLTEGDKISWAPIRGGVSADGTHGFTFGYLKLEGGNPRAATQKYLSYWVKRPQGWRVAAYRQMPRPAGEVSLDLIPPSLPSGWVPPVTDATAIAAHKQSLAQMEQEFSDEAQEIGLRAAFGKYGRSDAINMSPGSTFAIGLDAITAIFPDERTSPLYWSAERTLVASSGDLGVNIGTIHAKEPKAGQPSSFPFFTIWRRDSTSDPWRYVAE